MAREATIIWETGVSSRMTIRPEAQPSATHSATTAAHDHTMRHASTSNAGTADSSFQYTGMTPHRR